MLNWSIELSLLQNGVELRTDCGIFQWCCDMTRSSSKYIDMKMYIKCSLFSEYQEDEFKKKAP